MLLQYYRVHFYVFGVYAGDDAFLCRDTPHALRLAEYVKLAFARAAVDAPVCPRDVTYDVLAPDNIVARNSGLATCVS